MDCAVTDLCQQPLGVGGGCCWAAGRSTALGVQAYNRAWSPLVGIDGHHLLSIGGCAALALHDLAPDPHFFDGIGGTWRPMAHRRGLHLDVKRSVGALPLIIATGDHAPAQRHHPQRRQSLPG